MTKLFKYHEKSIKPATVAPPLAFVCVCAYIWKDLCDVMIARQCLFCVCVCVYDLRRRRLELWRRRRMMMMGDALSRAWNKWRDRVKYIIVALFGCNTHSNINELRRRWRWGRCAILDRVFIYASSDGRGGGLVLGVDLERTEPRDKLKALITVQLLTDDLIKNQ